MACVRRASAAARREKKHFKLVEISRQKYLLGGQKRNRIQRGTSNGSWLSALLHHLNGTELSQEEFQDNLCLRYGLMPQDIHATCNCCGKSFLIEHDLSCPNRGLVMARQDEAARSGAPLESGPSFLVILPTKRKSIVKQYRRRTPGLEHNRIVEHTEAAWIL